MFVIIKIVLQFALLIFANSFIQHSKNEEVEVKEFHNLRGKLNLTKTQIRDLIEYENDVEIANRIDKELLEKYYYINERRSEKAEFRILNGNDVEGWELNEVMWYAQVVNGLAGFFCGGFAVNKKLVITARHCITDSNTYDLRYLHVRLGSRTPLQGGELIKVKKIVFHSNQDLALIFTIESIDEGKTISVSKRFEIPGERCKFYGLGISGYFEGRPILPRIMQKTTVTIIRNKLTHYHHKHMFGVEGEIQQGDSGSPLIWREKGKYVVGGLALGEAQLADGRKIILFLRVSDFAIWITDELTIFMRDNNL